MITVYLLAAAAPVGFLTGVAARVLIPLSLGWPFGATLSGELGRTFHRWRQVVSVYCLIGVLFNLPLLRCTFAWRIQPPCTAWLEPVRTFTGLLHPNVSVEVLGTRWLGLRSVFTSLAFVFLYVRRFQRSKKSRSFPADR